MRKIIVQSLYNFNYFNSVQPSLFYKKKSIPRNRKSNWVICCYKLRRPEHRYCIILRTGSANFFKICSRIIIVIYLHFSLCCLSLN
jgi:hypothetical protein